ncbi:hypothetical protein P7K49_036468 [Saguinus oedipus]|uniref:Uncharacterized protein n=1 Tax=Saguinus oedipus TaxID=9490 RepID=A0ABQ9TKB0_SAGOE|nr:hypothetical protein P7K49_036468 [Saguinus oedipus]
MVQTHCAVVFCQPTAQPQALPAPALTGPGGQPGQQGCSPPVLFQGLGDVKGVIAQRWTGREKELESDLLASPQDPPHILSPPSLSGHTQVKISFQPLVKVRDSPCKEETLQKGPKGRERPRAVVMDKGLSEELPEKTVVGPTWHGISA